ncbi:MAG: hypothetical protein RL455_887 [Actinomycetota bacterium]
MVPLEANENAAPELNVRLSLSKLPSTFTGPSAR